MQKTPKRKTKTLHLQYETLRELAGLDLQRLAKVAGGAPTALCTGGPVCESDRRLKRAIRTL